MPLGALELGGVVGITAKGGVSSSLWFPRGLLPLWETIEAARCTGFWGQSGSDYASLDEVGLGFPARSWHCEDGVGGTGGVLGTLFRLRGPRRALGGQTFQRYWLAHGIPGVVKGDTWGPSPGGSTPGLDRPEPVEGGLLDRGFDRILS